MANIKWSEFPVENQILPGDKLVGLRASVAGQNAGFVSQIQQALSCRVLSDSNLDATYDNGVDGVGASLTDASGFGDLTIDGKLLVDNDRVAVSGQTDKVENGIYYLANQGDGVSIPWKLIRALDFNSAGSVTAGRYFTISAGDVYNGDVVVVAEPAALEIGIDNILLSSDTQYVINNFLRLTGGTMSGDIVMNNANIKTAATGSNNLSLEAYDTVNSVYREFIGLLSGASPICEISAPANSALFVNNAVIGNTTPQDGSFTDVIVTNGGALKSSPSSSNFLIQVYDTDNSVYRSFGQGIATTLPSFAWSQPSGGSLTWDGGAIGVNVPPLGIFSDLQVQGGGAFRTLQTTSAFTIQAYDNNDATYRTFATISGANTPSVVWSQPSGGTLTWDGGAIGSNTPASGAFTTLSQGGNAISLAGSLTTSGAFPATFTFTGSTNVTFPTSGTLATTGNVGISWSTQSGSVTLSPNTGTISTGTSNVLTLPSTCAVGAVIVVTNAPTKNYTIAQNSGQAIHFGSRSTTTGTGGSLVSTGDCQTIYMVCSVANTEFIVISSQGNITIA